VTHTTFQELLLTPFKVHEILGFEILSSEKHFCHWEISEILLRVRGLDPCRETEQNTLTCIENEDWALVYKSFPSSRPGSRLIEVNMTVIFSYKTQRTLFAMLCVLLNKPNQSYIVCVNIFVALYRHDSIPSWTLHFCMDQISRKGWVIQSWHNLNPDLFLTFLSPFLSPFISRTGTG